MRVPKGLRGAVAEAGEGTSALKAVAAWVRSITPPAPMTDWTKRSSFSMATVASELRDWAARRWRLLT
jgi:hypothetical protein